MTALLLDASVLLAAFDSEDDHHEAARALLEDEDATLATLDLARYEVADVAVRAWRASDSVTPLLAAVERLADEGGYRLVSCDERDLVSKGLAAVPADANDEGARQK